MSVLAGEFQEIIRSGSASRLVHRRAWVLNFASGSRISTHRKGTAGKPVLCQTAVSETISTVRCALPYQLATVMVLQTVSGSSATTERLGRRSPLSRGLPICPGWRGGAGLYRAASSLRRVMKVIGFLSLRQRFSSLRDA